MSRKCRERQGRAVVGRRDRRAWDRCGSGRERLGEQRDRHPASGAFVLRVAALVR